MKSASESIRGKIKIRIQENKTSNIKNTYQKFWETYSDLPVYFRKLIVSNVKMLQVKCYFALKMCVTSAAQQHF